MAAAKTPKPNTVGTMLKQKRLAKNLSLKQVEVATRVRGKYLVAIEADDYSTLPHDVYTRGFVQSYADFLGMDSAAIVKQYAAQRGEQELQLRRVSQLKSRRITVTPRLLTAVGGSALAVGVAAYFVWQLSALTAPPDLTISNPNKDQVVYGSLITISGHVDGGADVYVNDSSILVDDSGNFTDAIALQDGVNSIQVSAKNHLGKTSIVTRNVLAHVPKVDASSQLPAAPFDGVAVAVQVQKKSASVTVTADGKRVFSGTMLPGTTQIIKAKQSIKLSTSNAGATAVTVTNAVMANQNLGTLGSSGEPKSNFEFAKDTQFQ